MFTSSTVCDEGVVVVAGIGIGVARLALEGVRNPVGELGRVVRVAVAIQAAALVEVDHHLVNIVDIAAEFKRVPALCPAQNIGALDAMLVGLGNAGQRIGHAEGDRADATEGPAVVRARGLQIAAPLAVDFVHYRLLMVVVSPPTRKRS